MRHLISATALLFCLTLALTAQTTTHTLTSGAGPGSMSVTVDGLGSYGGCFTVAGVSDLTFDDGNAVHPTTCGSALLIHDPSGLTGNALPIPLASYTTGGFLSSEPAPPITVNVAGRDIVSTFMVPATGTPIFTITCRQIMTGPDPASGVAFEGSTLTQIYSITNIDPTFTTHVMDFARWVDGDIGPGTQYLFNRAGATADLATVFGPTPYTGNGHVVFQYDPTTVAPGPFEFVMMISMDVISDLGDPIENDKWEAIDNTGAAAWAPMGSSAASGLNNLVTQDLDGDLLQDTGIDCAMSVGNTGVTMLPGLTTTVITRTRLTRFTPQGAATPWERARDLTGSAYFGSYTGAGGGPILCVNNLANVVPVTPGNPISIQLAYPTGTSAGVYILGGVLGSPVTGNTCAAPRSMDFALWEGAGLSIGTGAFSMNFGGGLFATGGGAAGGAGGTLGIPLVSNLPNTALVTGLPAGGSPPCGSTILGPIGTSPNFPNMTLTLQAVLTDTNQPTGFAVSNAVTVVIGVCPTPVQ